MIHRPSRLALFLGAAVLLAAPPQAGADSPHVYGFHSWSQGCDINVMNGKTGWYVHYQIVDHSINLPALAQAKGEGFTIIIGLFDDWEEEIPLDRDEWPAFAARCAHLASQARDYCRIFHLDNEMEGNSTGIDEFTECFLMVRDEIKALYPEAIVSNGGTVGTTWFPKMAQRLGSEIDGYQTHVCIHPDNMYALAAIPGASRKPYYLTEFSKIPGYVPGYMQGYYADFNEWNENNEQKGVCACWFVYDLYGWYSHSLKWLPEPKADYQWLTENTEYVNQYAERPISIYDVHVDITSSAGGTVTWKTDVAATTQIEWYGESATTGRTSDFDPDLSTTHSAGFNLCVEDYRYDLWVRSTAYDYGDDAEHFTFGTNTSQAPGGWLRAGWNLVSLPLEPADPAADAVFDTAVAAGNDLTNDIFRYQGGYSMYPLHFTEMESGRGYWLRLDFASAEDCEGLNVTSDVELALDYGWNLIGQPHDYPTPLADCEVSDGATTLSFADAASAGWIADPAYFYDASGYRACSTAGGDDDSLQPWYGYWLLAQTDGLTLIIP